MDISAFKATCEECEQNFITPKLSDMSYSIFLYYTTDGKTVKYYEAIDDPVWQQVESTVQEAKPEMAKTELGKVIQHVIGLLADASGQETHLTTNIICPHCRAAVHTVDTSQKAETIDLETLSFTKFSDLTESRQKDKTLSILSNM